MSLVPCLVLLLAVLPPQADGTSPATAQPIELGKLTPVKLPKEGHLYLRFEATRPGIVQFSTRRLEEERDIAFTFYKGTDEEPLREGESDVRVSAGTYTVSLHERWGCPLPEPFQIIATFHAETDGTEPANDTRKGARTIELNKPITLELLPRGDTDFFRLDLPDSGILQLSVENLTAGRNLLPTFYDADSDEPIREREWDRRVARGITFISVRERWGQTVPDPFSLTFTLLPETDPSEPANDEKQGARPVEFDKPISLRILPREDVDFLRFEAPTDGVVQLSAKNLPAGHNLLFTFSDANSDEPICTDEWDCRVKKGASSVSVRERWGQAVPTPFDLTLTFTPEKDQTEPLNNNKPGARKIELDKPVSLQLLPSDDVDWFSVEVPSPGVLRASLEGVPTSHAIVVQFYTPSSDQPIRSEEYDVRVTPGPLFVSIHERWHQSIPQDIQLTLRLVLNKPKRTTRLFTFDVVRTNE